MVGESEQGVRESNSGLETGDEQGDTSHPTGPLARGRWEGKEPPLERAVGETVPSGTLRARQ